MVMAFIRSEATGFEDRNSWLFVHDLTIHRRPTGDYGNHIVCAFQVTVSVNWNLVFGYHFLFVPLDEVSLLTCAYLLNTRGFHSPMVLDGL